MTYQDIENDTMDRLGQSSGLTRGRVGRAINERYRWLATSEGMETTARGTVTAATSIGSRSLTFGPTPTPVQKLYAVYDATVTPPTILGEVSFEEMRQYPVSSGKARYFAVQLLGATSVQILLNATPTAIDTWTADAELNLSVLSGAMVPAFPEAFHDLLIYGAMATILESAGKYDEAKVQEKRYEQRCSDLRLFAAKSAFQDIYQGKTAPIRRWWV